MSETPIEEDVVDPEIGVFEGEPDEVDRAVDGKQDDMEEDDQ